MRRLALFLLLLPALGAVYYVDDTLPTDTYCTNYNVATRSCSEGSEKAWDNLDEFYDGKTNESVLAGNDTVYFRPGTYHRNKGTTDCDNTFPVCGLSTRSGTIGNPITYTTLAGEERQANICTHPNLCAAYNADPTDVGGRTCLGGTTNPGGSCSDNSDCWVDFPTDANAFCQNDGNFYFNGAAIVVNAHSTVGNMKSYGQAFVNGEGALLESNDIGGGGPSWGISNGQGMVITYKGDMPTAIIRNNYIHHSSKAPSTGNGPCIEGYDTSLTITMNTFAHCADAAIKPKDTSRGSATGDIYYITNNLFLKSNEAWSGTEAISGINQDGWQDDVYIKNNIIVGFSEALGNPAFYSNKTGLDGRIHQNTFIQNANVHYTSASGAAIGTDSRCNLFYRDGGNTNVTHNSSGGGIADDSTFDYNMYYTINRGDMDWLDICNDNTTCVRNKDHQTLKAFQKDGFGANSIEGIDPDFVDLTCMPSSYHTCEATDFKRSSYGENLADCTSNHAGAYATGNEQVGHDWGSSPAGASGRSGSGGTP